MKKHAGTLLMAAGMVLILVAMALAVLNIREDTEGEKAASQALDELLLMMPTAVVVGVPTEAPVLTDASLTTLTMEQASIMISPEEIHCQTDEPVLQSNVTPDESTTALTESTTGETLMLSELIGGTSGPTPMETVQVTDESATHEPVPGISTVPAITETPIPTPTLAPTPTLLPAYIRNPYIEMPVVKIEGRYYIGVLELPVLGLSLPVQTTWSESMLKASPCRYKGSAYTGDMIISGHNYTKHFSGLKNLRPGDEVIFTDANGNVFHYYVLETVILDGTEVKRMERGSDKWDLTLFTCTYGGASRLTVRCKEIK